jgi:hypothetical protein
MATVTCDNAKDHYNTSFTAVHLFTGAADHEARKIISLVG